MISDKELSEVRRLAAAIRKLKNENYDTVTWDAAIKRVVSENTRSENDFFRKTALLEFFIAEDKQLCPLNIFLENLDAAIIELKERSRDYAISETERLSMKKKIDDSLSLLKYPKNKKDAFDYYQILIDKIFVSITLTDLMETLYELGVILKEYYPNAFPEVYMFTVLGDKLKAVIDATAEAATKRQIASATEIDAESVGAIMYRFAQLGIFEVGKKGRENVYVFKHSDFDVNTLRDDAFFKIPFLAR